MESELQSAVKQQREAIETSELNPVSDDLMNTDSPAPLQPKSSSRHAKQVVNKGDDWCTNSVEQAPLNGHEAELAEGDIAAAAKASAADEDGTSRGARRPPSVNSERLPLPWSGRLGYVRTLQSRD
jgi:UV DNA damage endonuclease